VPDHILDLPLKLFLLCFHLRQVPLQLSLLRKMLRILRRTSSLPLFFLVLKCALIIHGFIGVLNGVNFWTAMQFSW
jgi:hypothetical protein